MTEPGDKKGPEGGRGILTPLYIKSREVLKRPTRVCGQGQYTSYAEKCNEGKQRFESK